MSLAGVAVLAAAGLGTGAALAVAGSSASVPNPVPAASSTAYTSPAYSWYRSMMSGYYGVGRGMMMESPSYGSYGWMMSAAGYRWMTGDGTTSPGWMRGALPAPMMGTLMTGTGADLGTVMGRLFGGAPGPHVSAAQAAALGSQVPTGARVTEAGNSIAFTSGTVRLVIVASSSGSDGTFRVAGLVNPRIIVPAGARIIIQLVNVGPDTAHGLVVTAEDTVSPMPMMTAQPAFAGSALWFLGSPMSAGIHEGTLAFTATTPGTYQYLCPIPGHAREGMTGTFMVL
jgi:hypothetical protein